MTAPSDFLDLDRFEDDGGKPARIEEQWDEPERVGGCDGCGRTVLENEEYAVGWDKQIGAVVLICEECKDV